MNNIKKLLLITLISSVAIFSSCGDDDDATVSCLKCTFSEENDPIMNAALNVTWVDQCPGDVLTDPDTGEEIGPLTAASIAASKEMYENPELFGGTCVYVDKN